MIARDPAVVRILVKLGDATGDVAANPALQTRAAMMVRYIVLGLHGNGDRDCHLRIVSFLCLWADLVSSFALQQGSAVPCCRSGACYLTRSGPETGQY